MTVFPLRSLRQRTPRVAAAVSISIWIGELRRHQNLAVLNLDSIDLLCFVLIQVGVVVLLKS